MGPATVPQDQLIDEVPSAKPVIAEGAADGNAGPTCKEAPLA